jgi:hypothetical protein
LVLPEQTVVDLLELGKELGVEMTMG